MAAAYCCHPERSEGSSPGGYLLPARFFAALRMTEGCAQNDRRLRSE
jgi:hypothetical protein